MGATSADHSTGGGTDQQYERVEAGVYPGRCIQVVELGTHSKHYPAANGKPAQDKEVTEMMIAWELSEPMQDGRPFVVTWQGTNSLNEKANLCKMLESWRGKKFTDEEKKRFEMKNILDVCCMLNISKTESKNGKTYNNVVTVMPLPKGMKCDDRVNELVDFGICDLKTPEFDKLWPWVQTKVLASKEATNPEQPTEDQPAMAF